MDFHKIRGFPVLLILFNSEDPEIRWRTLQLVATLVQNNTYCQTAALKDDLLSKMLTILDKDSDATVKTKALYAISCLTRDVPEAQKVFCDKDGFSIVMRAMQCDVEKLKIKAAFMLSQMCSSNPAFKDILCDIGMIDQLVGELGEEHVNYHEHLMSALLAIVKDHQRAIEECQRTELQLTQLLLNRIEFLKGKEEFLEEKSYAEELLSIISSESGDVMR
ncbi:hypothetical protein FSP39_014379 [Pinctada imbricata]|uniref:Uncharacterized protein n=1 Tax=Pinctada imbricata TaxID=66713 RepID=A0AA88YN47_PINIB|nr:hypothetical protein FSP39_014379 [Pinctada imbricata]